MSYMSAWTRAATRRAARYQGYLRLMSGRYDPRLTKATRIDTPARSESQITHDHNTTEPERREALSGAIAPKHQEEEAIKPSSPKMIRTVKPHDERCRTRFKGGTSHRPKPKGQISQQTVPIRPPGPKKQGALKKPRKEITMANTVITNTASESSIDDWECSDDDDDDDDADDDFDDTLIMEEHPLKRYPAVDDSTFLERMEVPTRAQPRRSLLTEQIAKNTVRYTAADKVAMDRQRCITQRSLGAAQKWETTGREAGLLRPYMTEAGEGWGFEQPDLLGPPVVKGYGNRP
ncbi:hypothetical protein F5B22DRAFT_627295 [Xylaria bambusicola]|uniref:uncharacterized protein n=1 Tax=Xylaria bambusicola TaxID=326684 RepID=UPI002007E9C2|nr:uncharacterized protein F5B22DRAFT_627295 [Xylaria bambusicola]KAI0505658.1 hypothetical protein F5B22DRAFT_627295 [Xylaria bambusicola]